MSDQHLTASSITDPKLDDLLAELARLRAAVHLHAPRRKRGKGQVCRTCRGTAWPCPTARTAAAPARAAANGDGAAGPDGSEEL
ncbi:hypothetical protein [Streptomyces sp. NPDC058084]|uniref:hypothetical protein n=1 Tax=Streptomyces sp. NPDC058084 TaxID=3346333 RepID=UPI0036E13FB8